MKELKAKHELQFGFNPDIWITRRTEFNRLFNPTILVVVWYICMLAGFSISLYGLYEASQKYEIKIVERVDQ